MAKTIDDYIKEVTNLAEGRELSLAWYRRQVKTIVPQQISPANIIKSLRESDNKRMRPTYGIMNLYYYNPKTEETLPYYDRFPLVIPIQRVKGGFVGINFHYLDLPLRAKLFEKMLPMSKENRILGWRAVSKLKQVRPCVKRYLINHVESKFLKITEEEMPIALWMPVQRFYSKSRRFNEKEVWKDSRRMI